MQALGLFPLNELANKNIKGCNFDFSRHVETSKKDSGGFYDIDTKSSYGRSTSLTRLFELGDQEELSKVLSLLKLNSKRLFLFIDGLIKLDKRFPEDGEFSFSTKEGCDFSYKKSETENYYAITHADGTKYEVTKCEGKPRSYKVSNDHGSIESIGRLSNLEPRFVVCDGKTKLIDIPVTDPAKNAVNEAIMCFNGKSFSSGAMGGVSDEQHQYSMWIDNCVTDKPGFRRKTFNVSTRSGGNWEGVQIDVVSQTDQKRYTGYFDDNGEARIDVPGGQKFNIDIKPI